jgi:NitT/TauT family transport system permease protein
MSTLAKRAARLKSLRRVGFALSLLVAWTVGSLLTDNPLVPTPVQVLQSVELGVRDGSFPVALVKSLSRLLLGYGVSLVGGIFLGVSFVRSELLRDTVGMLGLGLQALPSVCWMPIALLLFGLSDAAIQTVLILGSLLSISIATESAVRAVPPILVRAARTMGASGATLYTRVVLPAALPGLVSGARLGWTFAWRSLMAGELLFASGGLGQLLQNGREIHDMARVVAVMAVIIAVGLLCEYAVFARIETQVRRTIGLERT